MSRWSEKTDKQPSGLHIEEWYSACAHTTPNNGITIGSCTICRPKTKGGKK